MGYILLSDEFFESFTRTSIGDKTLVRLSYKFEKNNNLCKQKGISTVCLRIFEEGDLLITCAHPMCDFMPFRQFLY